MKRDKREKECRRKRDVRCVISDGSSRNSDTVCAKQVTPDNKGDKHKKESQRKREASSVTSSVGSINSTNVRPAQQVPTGRPSCSVNYAPAALASLIGNGDTEIPDDIIVAALNLMKLISNNQLQPYIGYFTPAEIQYAISVNPHDTSSLVKPALPDGQFSINIHPLPGHWVTSCYYPDTNQLHVYDSLMSATHFQEVIPQLNLIYGAEKTSRAIYSEVTQQGFQPLCGVMAVCYAFSCFLGQNPVLIDYDITAARAHLRKCVTQGEVLPFPEKRLALRSTQQVFNINGCVDDTILSLNRYFKDQSIKTTEHELTQQVNQSESKKKNISNKNKNNVRNRQTLTKEKARQRQYKHRMLLSENEACAKKHTEKVRKHLHRSSFSTAEKWAQKEKDQLRKQIKRQSQVESEKTSVKIKDKLRKQLARNLLKDSEKEKTKDKIRKQISRSSLSHTEKLALKEKDKLRKQKKRQSQIESEKISIKAKDQLKKQLARSILTDSEKIQIENKDKLRKQSARKLLTKSNKDLIKNTDKLKKQTSRCTVTETERESAKKQDKLRKQASRLVLNEKEKETAKNYDKLRKHASRLVLSEKEKETAKNYDKLRKHASTLVLNEKEKEAAKNYDKLRKHASRMVMTESDKIIIKERNKLRKQSLRTMKPESEKQTSKKKDKIRKNLSRQSLSEIKRLDRKDQERMRSQSRRASMSSIERNLQKAVDQCRKQSKRQKMTISEKETQNDKNRNVRQNKRHKTTTFSGAIFQFHFAISQGPVYVCASCLRQLYRQSVVELKDCKYQSLVNQIISKENPCFGKVWVCNTCHKYLLKGKTPPQNFSNNLSVDKLPSELQGLTSLESHLISQRIPFMKIMSRPRGGQKAISGAVVNVPIDAYDTCKTLPRPAPNSAFIMLKLKRKQEYKSSVVNQVIRPSSVVNALKVLMKINPLYNSIQENDNAFIVDSNQEEHKLWNEILSQDTESNENVNQSDSVQDLTESSIITQSEKESCAINSSDIINKDNEITSQLQISDTDEDSEDEDLEILDTQKGLPLDTCLQPLECQGNDIFSIAPAEGNKPISLFNDPNAELLAFPALFPYGRFSSTSDRPIKLHFRKYLNARLLNVDSRFATNIDYIFFMQFLAEKKQIIDNVQIVLRKSQYSESITAASLRSDKLKTFIAKDLAYTILKNIRGSPAYWQRCMYDLLGMVRQLGLFTWFLTLSSADLRWKDTIKIIAQQAGVILSDADIDKMSWEERCKWIRNNPVTAARHFDYKVQQFFKLIIQKTKVLGDVTNFFIRTEFQQRGSPHIHCVLWVKDAPVLGKQSDEEVCSFIDKYIMCTLPDDDQELFTLVSTLQKHSHTKTCRKRGQFCRFHFPKPPVLETIIATDEKIADVTATTAESSKPTEMHSDVSTTSTDTPPEIPPPVNYKQIFITVQQYIQQVEENCPNVSISLSQVLEACQVSEDLYVETLKKLQTGTKVLHKRQPRDIYINNYNPIILKAWQANMDLQYVTDVYSCIMYIVSYITKDERELSDLLRHASKQANDCNIQQQLRQLGNVFLNHREITAQEAIYRALPLPLRRTSNSVIFLPTDLPEDRVKLVKPACIIEQLDDDSEEVFCTSILDRYIARPVSLDAICLAQFASWYTVTSNVKEDFQPVVIQDETTEAPPGRLIKLKDGKGFMTKRTRQAIIRAHVYSKLKEPEKYYHSKLMLYIPWRDEAQLKLHFSTFEEAFKFFEHDVNYNMEQFEHNSEHLDTALQDYEENGPLADVWDTLNSEAIQRDDEDLSCPRMLDTERAAINPEFFTGIHPHDIRSDIGASSVSCSLQQTILPDNEFRELVRMLNSEQTEIFNEILRWCRQYICSRRYGQKPSPFYTFVTGGAGTGKSLFIKAIYNAAVRELREEGDNPSECTVLLTAPTGTAAFNINGITLHSALKLPIKQHRKKNEDYQPLSQEKLHDLRYKLNTLVILIIDEISMVSSQDFYNIHRRLTEINGTSQAEVYFGGVSVLAVGDLFQIPPVAAKPVYTLPNSPLARLAGSLWNNLFSIHHLQTIMRQKEDVDFANMLNRIRLQTHTNEDVKVLESRLINPEDPLYPHDALHIFPTNEEVDIHNANKLASLRSPLVTLTAKDVKSDNSPLPETFSLPSKPALTGGLYKTVTLCKGARVMITKNIDVADGLVNGTQGLVLGFWPSDKGNEIKAVIINCDHQQTGEQIRLKYPHIARKFHNGVPIFRDEVHLQYYTSGVIRQQFPLRLSWACTVHKTQGMTLSKAVVSIAGRFNDGQCYVALSRVTSLNGLYITKFNKDKIRASKQTVQAIETMNSKLLIPFSNPVITRPSNIISVALLNTRSIVRHEKDIEANKDLIMADILCFTETWLKAHRTPTFAAMQPFRQDRSHKRAGGVLAYITNNFESSCLQKKTTKHIDILSLKVQAYRETFFLILLYCPPDANVTEAIATVNDFTSQIPSDQQLIILGDFNLLSLKNNVKYTSLYTIVEVPTCRTGSVLDQVYTNWKLKPFVFVSPAYFTDHNILWIALPGLHPSS